MAKNSNDEVNRISIGRRIINSALVLFLVLIVIGVSGYGYIRSTATVISTSDKVAQVNDIKAVEPVKRATEMVNILVLGADYVEGETKDFSLRRTDTMMVVNYNPTTKKIFGVSIPRDTVVEYKGEYEKINAINAYGGPKLTVPTVEELLGVKINYYVMLDYEGFNAVIDAIGGVTVTTEYRMKYDDDLQDYHIDYQPGETVKLDGKGAEIFFRWRKNNDGIPVGTRDAGGDLGRIDNQRILINAVAEKAASISMVPKIPGVLKTCTQYVATNMTADDIMDYGVAIASIGRSNIEFATLEGDTPEIYESIEYPFVYKPYDEKNQVSIARLNNIPVEQAKKFNKANLKVNIINGTNISGLAGNLKSELAQNQGFMDQNVQIGNSNENINESVIEVYGLDKSFDDIIRKEFLNTKIDNVVYLKSDTEEFDIVVKYGLDYKN